MGKAVISAKSALRVQYKGAAFPFCICNACNGHVRAKQTTQSCATPDTAPR